MKITNYVCKIFNIPKSKFSGLFILLCSFFIIYSFFQSLHDATKYPGIDLRSRIVSARLMLLGESPFFFVQDENTSPELVDPNNPSKAITGCTYPPTLVSLYIPLCGLNYKFQRYIWVVIEWGLFLFSLIMLVRILPSEIRILGLCMSVVFFACGYFWRLHVERGQYYVFILFLWSLSAWYAKKYNGDNWKTGVPLGFAAALRPSLFAAYLLFVIFRMRKITISAFLCGFLFIGFTCIIFGPSLWGQYYKAVHMREMGVLQEGYIPKDMDQNLFKNIEGYPDKRGLDSKTTNLTITDILSRIEFIDANNKVLIQRILFSMFFAGIASIYYIYRYKFQKPEEILTAVFFVSLVSDYFVPLRYGYVDIQFMAPLMLLLAIIDIKNNKTGIIFILLGLLTGHSIVDMSPDYATLCRSAGVMLGIMIIIFNFGIIGENKKIVSSRPVSPDASG